MPRTPNAKSHWHHSVEGLSTSALEFYSSVEMALKGKQAPVSIDRVYWNEGGILSGKREYLRVGYGRFVFDIGAAPFGKDYFFSWWLAPKTPGIMLYLLIGIMVQPIAWAICVWMGGFIGGTVIYFLVTGGVMLALMQDLRMGTSEFALAVFAIPYLGSFLERLLSPTTYYSEDTRQMFEETVHRVVMEVIAGILVTKGMTPLTAAERSLKAREE